MPKLWRHVIVNTHCSWLHGDERGFRSRNHRIHSSGDYKNPPPAEEHAGLREHHELFDAEAVEFALDVRVLVIRDFISKAKALGHRAIACLCGAEHLHVLVELPAAYLEAKREIGKCKQKVSHALREVLPGAVWSAGGEYKPVTDTEHFRAVYAYVRTKQEPCTVVWSHRPEEDWIADPSIGWWEINGERQLVRVATVGEA